MGAEQEARPPLLILSAMKAISTWRMCVCARMPCLPHDAPLKSIPVKAFHFAADLWCHMCRQCFRKHLNYNDAFIQKSAWAAAWSQRRAGEPRSVSPAPARLTPNMSSVKEDLQTQTCFKSQRKSGWSTAALFEYSTHSIRRIESGSKWLVSMWYFF